MAKTTQLYLNNPSLPAADAEFEYTPEMVKEIDKCKDNLMYFAETYFYIVSLDEGRQTIQLHGCQKRALRKMRDNRFFILLASRQIGKALALDTKIPTPTGWTTMGELKDGDLVYGLNGKPCKVVKAHDVLHNRKCYEVVFDNGQTIVADADHLWFTETKSERRKGGSVKTTQEIFETCLAGKEPNHRIPSCITGVIGERKNLPIDPYVLGMWLGDGDSSSGTITVGERDLQDVLNIFQTQQSQFDKFILHEYNKNVYTLRITSETEPHKNSLSTVLRSNRLIHNKHIPSEYMLASREQRLSLLQGLIDSDGYINKKGVCQFYNTNISLVKQVKQLTESLGYKVTYKELIPKLNGVECSKCGIITFTPIEYVVRLLFKRSRIRIKPFNVESNFRSQWHYIKEVKEIESVPVRCITVDSPDSLYLAGEHYIPTHNTTLLTIYAMWLCCFQKDQSVLIIANKENTAAEIFRRFRLAYEELPNWLKPGVVEYQKTSATFANGSRVLISTTTGTAARGQSISLLLLDELAFVDNADEFWRSVYPIVSSSKKSKILITSTANGTGNLFHKLYSDAENKRNGWACDKILWNEIPGRDQHWKELTIATLGDTESFEQEYNCKFLQFGNSMIPNDIFDKIDRDIRVPKYTLEENAYNIWEDPNEESLYVAGVDVGEGVGQDNTVLHIFDVTDLTSIRQVASFVSNKIPPVTFVAKLHEILKQWGSPLVAVERNNCGAQVVDGLRHTHMYENIISWSKPNPYISAALKTDTRLGIISNQQTKYVAVTNMRYWLKELFVVKVRDKQLLYELKHFVVKENGSWSAMSGYHDDRVMALVWSLVVLDKFLCDKYFEIVRTDLNGRPAEIRPHDFGIKYFTPSGTFPREGDSNVIPTVVGNFNEPDDPSLQDLISAGYRPLQ